MEKLIKKSELGIYRNTETKRKYSLKRGKLEDGTNITFYLNRGTRIVIPKKEMKIYKKIEDKMPFIPMCWWHIYDYYDYD